MKCWGTHRSLITWPRGSLLICLGLCFFLHPRRWQLKRAFLRSIIHDRLPPKLGNLKGEAVDLGTRSTYPLHTSERECLHCPQGPSLPSFSLELLISVHSVPLDSGSQARRCVWQAPSRPSYCPTWLLYRLCGPAWTWTAKGPGVRCPVHTPPRSCFWIWPSLAEGSSSLGFGTRSRLWHGRERGSL